MSIRTVGYEPRLNLDEKLNALSADIEAIERRRMGYIIAIELLNDHQQATAALADEVAREQLQTVNSVIQGEASLEQALEDLHRRCDDLVRIQLTYFDELMEIKKGGARDGRVGIISEGKVVLMDEAQQMELRNRLEQKLRENIRKFLEDKPIVAGENLNLLRAYFEGLIQLREEVCEQLDAQKEELTVGLHDFSEQYKEHMQDLQNQLTALRRGVPKMNIFLAVQQGLLGYVERKLKSSLFNQANQILDDGYGLLHVAAFAEQREVVQLLLECKADPNKRDTNGVDKSDKKNPLAKTGNTPMHWAAKKGNKLIMELLHQKGAKIEIHGREGRTPLDEAVWGHRHQAAAWLLQQGANPNAKLTEGWTVIHQAVLKGDMEMLEVLLSDPRTDVCAVDNHLSSPLKIAVLEGNLVAIALITSHESWRDFGEAHPSSLYQLFHTVPSQIPQNSKDVRENIKDRYVRERTRVYEKDITQKKHQEREAQAALLVEATKAALKKESVPQSEWDERIDQAVTQARFAWKREDKQAIEQSSQQYFNRLKEDIMEGMVDVAF